MKRFILPLLLMLLSALTYSQQRDLDYYLNQATINSPLIQKNKNDNKILDLDLQQRERILNNPEINLESNILLAPIISHDGNSNRLDVVSNGSNNYQGYDLAITNGGQYQAFLAVKQPLLGKSNLKVYKQKSDISRKQNINSTTMTIHEIEQLVGYQYILCLKSKVQIKNGVQLLKQLDDQLIIMQKLVQSAIYKQTDLLLLQIERQNLVIANKTYEDDYLGNLFDLNLLCGIQDSSKVDITELDLQMKPDLGTNSFFRSSIKLDSLALMADLSISELKYKPQLSLFANAGLNAAYLPSFDRLGFSTGFTFSLNLYDGNQRKFDREKSTVGLETARFEKNHLLTQREINIAKIKSQLNSLRERTTLIENQLIQYDKLYEAYQIDLRRGLISIIDYKNLMRDITVKKQESILLRMQKQVLINTYNYWNY